MLDIKKIQKLIDEKIPSDLVTPRHTYNHHYYHHRMAGETYASVTTKTGILDSPHLKQWAANLAVQKVKESLPYLTPENQEGIFNEAQHAHKDVLKDAGGVGTRGHDIIEKYLLDWIAKSKQPKNIIDFIPKEEHDPRIWAIIRSAELFCNEWEIAPVRSELLVASVKHKYAGTLDALMMVKGKLCIVDWKTSNTIDKPEYAMQVSAYWKALAEMVPGLRIHRIYIVQLDKKKMKYKIVRIKNRTKAFSAFVHCCKIYDWLYSREMKLIDLNRKTFTKL